MAANRLTYFIKSAELAQRTLTEPRFRALDLTYGQLAVLLSIDRLGSPSSADVARLHGMTPQSAGEVISTLIGKGFVTRGADSRSKRIQRLSVSVDGRNVLSEANRLLDELERFLIDGLDENDVAAARRVLEHIASLHP